MTLTALILLPLLGIGGLIGTLPAEQGVLVLDAHGTAASGAQVEVVSKPRTKGTLASLTAPYWSTSTGDDGRFDLQLPSGRQLLVAIDHPGSEPFLEVLTAPFPKTLHLAVGETLRGAIVKPKREEWQGEACARWESRLDGWQRRFSSTRCGSLSEDGAFRISGVPPSRVEVVVTAMGFLPRHLELAPGEVAQVTVDPGVLLHGTVRDEHQGPIAGAAVRGGESVHAFADEEGHFEIAVESLPAALRVSAEGFSPTMRRVVGSAATKPVNIVLRSSQRLVGSVHAAGGDELRAIEIRLRRRINDTTTHRSRHRIAVEDGEFELTLDHPGQYDVSISSEGYRESTFPGVVLGESQRYDLGRVELSAGGIVRARLVDGRSGDGIGSAQVELLPRGDEIFTHLAEGRNFNAVSGDDGAVEIRGAEAGEYELRVDSEGYAPWHSEVSLDQDELVDLGALYLAPGTVVSGRVVDRRGAPVAAATIRFLDPEGATLLPLAERTTDGDGAFREVTLMPGAYRVRVARERLLLSRELEVPDRDSERVELVTSGVELHGQVSRKGQPVAHGALVIDSELDPGVNGNGKVVVHTGGEVSAGTSVYGLPQSSVTAQVGGDGTFFVKDAPSGPLEATYYDPGGPPVKRRIVVSDQPSAWIEIDVGGVTLKGRTFDRATAAGVPATIQLVAPSGRVVGRGSSGVGGLFQVSDLAPGTYGVRVEAQGYRSELLESVPVEQDGSPLQVGLEAADSGSLVATMLRSDGSPLAGAFVSLIDDAGTTVRSLLSDAGGQRRYDDLSPGRYYVVWSAATTGVGVSQPLEVRAGETTEWQHVAPPSGSVTLSCGPSICGGRPLSHLLVFSSDTGVELGRFLGGMAAGATFSAQGRLTLGSLAPGRYLVSAGVGGVALEATLAVSPDANLVVDLHGPPAGTPIAGKSH